MGTVVNFFVHLLLSQIEKETKQFMEESFKQLRSAEGAFDLLQRFRNIDSRPEIKEQMEKQTTDILSQFEKEVD